MNRFLRIFLPVLMISSMATSLLGVGVASAAAGDGTGTMTVSPTTATPSSTNNTFTFTYTLTSNFNFSFASNAEITVAVPSGFTAPLGSNTTVTSTCSLGTIAFSGQLITAPRANFSSCASGNTITIVYEIAGHLITAPSAAGPYLFTTQSRNWEAR